MDSSSTDCSSFYVFLTYCSFRVAAGWRDVFRRVGYKGRPCGGGHVGFVLWWEMDCLSSPYLAFSAASNGKETCFFLKRSRKPFISFLTAVLPVFSTSLGRHTVLRLHTYLPPYLHRWYGVGGGKHPQCAHGYSLNPLQSTALYMYLYYLFGFIALPIHERMKSLPKDGWKILG